MLHRKEESDELMGPVNLVVAIVLLFYENEDLEIKAHTNLVAMQDRGY